MKKRRVFVTKNFLTKFSKEGQICDFFLEDIYNLFPFSLTDSSVDEDPHQKVHKKESIGKLKSVPTIDYKRTV